MTGLADLITHNAVLLLVAVGLGIAIGRFALPLGRGSRVPQPPAGEAPAAGDPPTEDRQALDEAQRQLWAARAEAAELRAAIVEATDRKDTELGRLETAAIEALESTIATHRRDIAQLERQIAAERAHLHQALADRDDERRRAERLTIALSQRTQGGGPPPTTPTTLTTPPPTD